MCENDFGKKLWPHEINAIIDALAILETVPEANKQVQDGTISTLRAMVGIKGKFDDYMNDAIAEIIENERKKKDVA